HRVGIAALDRVAVVPDEFLETLVAEGPQSRLLAAAGNGILCRGPGALQRVLHRRDGGTEQVGRLLAGEPEHLAKDEHRPLERRKVLKCRDEGQLEALPPLILTLRRG